MLPLLPFLLLLPLTLARTDLAGCTSSISGSSLIWAVPGTGELCIFLDCGGARAPPKTTVPGCPAYEGTETYIPSFLPSATVASTAGEVENTITTAPESVETGTSVAVEETAVGSAVELKSTAVVSTSAVVETSAAATRTTSGSTLAQNTALPTITGSNGAGRAGGKAGVMLAGVGMLAGMLGFRANNVLHRNHFRKDWQSRVKTWFDQPGKKHSRRSARQAKAVKAGLRPTELLRPAVRCPTKRYNTKLRSGRGFTYEELKAAGIRRKEALSIGIPVDHRRRNKSEEGLKINTERLAAYKARLVVFPRKAGKVKAGDSADANVNVESLRTLAATFPIPSGTTLEAPRAITAAEREVKAFTALRMARSEGRYVGVRAERQKKKDEEEAAKKK